MSAAPAVAAPEELLRARLAAAAAVAGFTVEITDRADWAVENGTVRIGLQWLRDRGHSGDAAVALALLLMWESVRIARESPEQRVRIAAIVRREPELEPLLMGVVRVLAVLDISAAFPAFARALRAALVQDLPEDLLAAPRTAQYVAATVLAGSGVLPEVLPEVLAELEMLGASRVAGCDPIRRAGAPGRPRLDRFERLCALLLPGYRQLLAQDRASRGLTHAATAAGEESREESSPEGPGLGTGAGTGDAEHERDAESVADGESREARAGDRAESAEGADLFAAEQAGAVRDVLATPLPATGAWVDGIDPPEPNLAVETPPDAPAPDRRGMRGPGLRHGTPPVDYRTQLDAHASEIERLRELWERIISDRVALRRTWTRTPEPEGELLDRDALVRAVTESRAGVRRPAAYRSRTRRPRRAHRTGSTDYVFLIDRSASMQGARAEDAATAALIMLEALAGVERDIRHSEARWGIELALSIRTSLILFDAEAIVLKPLAGALTETARREVFSEVQRPHGSTNDAAALQAALTEFESAGSGADGLERRRVVLMVSDGGTNDPQAASAALDRLRALGIAVYGFGIGSDDLTVRYAPLGMRIGDASEVPEALARFIEQSRFDLESTGQ